MTKSIYTASGRIDKPAITKQLTSPQSSDIRQSPQTTLAQAYRRFNAMPSSAYTSDILQLQRSLGNRAVGALLGRSKTQRPVIQAKLTVNFPGDQYEQEADRVAEEVMRMPTVQQKELDEEDAPEIMAKPLTATVSHNGFEANPEFEQQLNASRGRGEPLPPGLCGEFEDKFRADFGAVRIHRDNRANALNQAIGARAFTSGQDVFFSQGTYEPNNRGGQALLAHELTHVVQQTGFAGDKRTDATAQGYRIQASTKKASMPGLQGNKGKSSSGRAQQPQKGANKGSNANQPDAKPSTTKKTKGEISEDNIRARLRGIGPTSEAYGLENGVMDLIAGTSLNGTSNVVELPFNAIKAKDSQKQVVVDLLAGAPVQSGNTSTSAWHKNDHKKLPKFNPKEGAVKDWELTPYLEFLIQGYKQRNMIERAVFDTSKGEVYMTTHYTIGSFVKLTGLPNSVITSMNQKAEEAKEEETNQEG